MRGESWTSERFKSHFSKCATSEMIWSQFEIYSSAAILSDHRYKLLLLEVLVYICEIVVGGLKLLWSKFHFYAPKTTIPSCVLKCMKISFWGFSFLLFIQSRLNWIWSKIWIFIEFKKTLWHILGIRMTYYLFFSY